MNKKAITQDWVIGLILLIVGAGILLLFINPFNEASENIFDKTSCQTSVDARAAILGGSGLLSAGKLKLPPLECSTNYVCLTKGSDCNEKYQSIKTENMEDIKKEMAGLMYDCWDMLGKGEKQFLRSSDDTQCIICSVIQFQQSIQNDYKTIDGLNEYLFEKTIPTKDVTYIEFINGEPNPDIKDESYDTSKKLAVLYVVASDKSTIEKWTDKALGVGALITYPINIIKSFVSKETNNEAVSLSLAQYDAEELYEVCKDIKGVV